MPLQSINEIIQNAELQEKQARKRAIALTFIPLLFAILLITYTAEKIIKAQKELDNIEGRMTEANNRVSYAEKRYDSVSRENETLIKQNDSLKKSLIETTVLLGKQVSVFSEFKKFVDNIKTYDRSYEEAAFWINYKMLEDKIRGNYDDLSKKVSNLPNLDSNTVWVVVVSSSSSLEDLRKEAAKVVNIYGRDETAIYKTNNSTYVLAVKGNGTFTRAYRLNVELRDKYKFAGAYFSSSANWGKDYLNTT